MGRQQPLLTPDKIVLGMLLRLTHLSLSNKRLETTFEGEGASIRQRRLAPDETKRSHVFSSPRDCVLLFSMFLVMEKEGFPLSTLVNSDNKHNIKLNP